MNPKNKPLFSIVIITKNEQETLVRCLSSLGEFLERGGQVVVVDTGSTDGTVINAKSFGCKVSTFTSATIKIDAKTANEINEKFVHKDEPKIIYEGDVIFDFALARNNATMLSDNDFVFSLDADEVYTNLDIDAINKVIKSGADQIHYQFIYDHNPDGSPRMMFKQFKGFNKWKMKWAGVVHEMLYPINGQEIKQVEVSESVMLLEHHQEPNRPHRDSYIKGLAYDVWKNPGNDRNIHYLAREFYYKGMYKSAIAGFKLHLTATRPWYREVAQSHIYISYCMGYLDGYSSALRESHILEAIGIDPYRREPWLAMAWKMYNDKNYRAAACYAKAAIDVPYSEFYGNNMSDYNETPYEILYLSYGWMGDIEQARHFNQLCQELRPDVERYKEHARYYNPSA